MTLVRYAQPADVDAMVDRDRRLIGVHHAWAASLGDGVTAADYLALVAVDDSDISVGHICLGPIKVEAGRTRGDLDPGVADAATIPWWKVDALAVEPEAQGKGVSRALLAEAVERTPSTIDGLYGNVEDDRPHEIGWYRRQGFHITASLDVPTGRDGPNNFIRLESGQGSVFFSSLTHNLTEHLRGRGNSSASRLAQVAYAAFVRNYRRTDPPRVDLGYRLYARRLATSAAPTCLHGPMGPRPLVVYAWDPQLRRVCLDCHINHLTAIKRYDNADRCDCCKDQRIDVQVSWDAREDELLVVNAGLCGPCRAGQCPHNQPTGDQPIGTVVRPRRGKRKERR